MLHLNAAVNLQQFTNTSSLKEQSSQALQLPPGKARLCTNRRPWFLSHSLSSWQRNLKGCSSTVYHQVTFLPSLPWSDFVLWNIFHRFFQRQIWEILSRQHSTLRVASNISEGQKHKDKIKQEFRAKHTRITAAHLRRPLVVKTPRSPVIDQCSSKDANQYWHFLKSLLVFFD